MAGKAERSSMIQSYRDLTAWQKGMDLVEETYRIVKCLPKEELFALSGQMRRAAVSIPSNIAEGYARRAPKDYARFLAIARGSVNELQTQLLLCVRLGYIHEEEIGRADLLCEEVNKILYSILAKL